ncbi:MAG: glycosyltransferase [Thermoleophilaceae bacterium]
MDRARSLVTLEHRDPDADALVVTNMWPHAGVPNYGIFVKRQVGSLIDAGLRCDVLFVRGFESPLAYPAAALRLLRLSLGRRRYRLVHAHGGETLVPALFFLRGPRVVSFSGDDLLGTPRPDGTLSRASRIRAAVLRLLAPRAARTITKSRELETRLPARVQSRNTVLPNGVDTRLFAPGDRAAARAELGWDPDERVALFGADPAVERKRHPLAVAACEEAGRRGVPVRLHVAHGARPEEMPLLMNASDCLLLTSAIEGSPNVVKEALMCDLPVVSTGVGDVRELLADVEPSRVCDDTPQALADGLVAVLATPARSDGRARSEWLDQRRIAERLLAVYDGLR